MEHNINYGKTTTGLDIKKVEKKLNAKYIGDFCLKVKGGQWSNLPAAVFYQETPPKPEYSHYAALFVDDQRRVCITCGASAFAEPIDAVRAADGELIYSRFTHDFRSSTDGSVTVDGGRQYMRVLFNGTPPESVKLVISKDRLVPLEDQQNSSSVV